RFQNPYLQQYRQRFNRGRIWSADGKVLAESVPIRSQASGVRREGRPDSGWRLTSDAWRLERQRRYPLGPASAQLIGWTTQGKFTPGRGSVETLYDDQLRGYRERDLPHLFRTRHNPLAAKPRPRDVRLSIDSRLQLYAARKLQETVRRTKGVGGAA